MILCFDLDFREHLKIVVNENIYYFCRSYLFTRLCSTIAVSDLIMPKYGSSIVQKTHISNLQITSNYNNDLFIIINANIHTWIIASVSVLCSVCRYLRRSTREDKITWQLLKQTQIMRTTIQSCMYA